MTIADTLHAWFQRRTARRDRQQFLSQHAKLPQPRNFDDLSRWRTFLERWHPQITFHRYSAHFGLSVPYQGTYNNVDELLDALRHYEAALDRRREIALKDVAYLPLREGNLDYFLTDASGRPLDIRRVFESMLGFVNRLAEAGIAIETQQDIDLHDFEYYKLRGEKLFGELTQFLGALFYASDLIRE